MNKFKQLFCKHDYKLYSDTKVFPTIISFSRVNGFKYVCHKCGKEITIVSTDLINEIDELKETLRKKIVLGEDVSDMNNDSEFVIKAYDYSVPTLYSGRHIDVLKKRYKNCGIDLDEITKWYRR